MAKVRKKDKDTTKWKKKRWYTIIAPPLFNNSMLGETTIYEPSEVIGKALETNLMSLTGEVKNQNVNMKFKIIDFKDNTAQTQVIGYTLSPAFIKRVVRRRHTRVDSTYRLETKDKKKIIIKSLFITRSKANRSEMAALKQQAYNVLNKFASSHSYDDLIRNMVLHRLQQEIRRTLSKVYPLKTCDIKKMELVEKSRETNAKAKD